MAVDLATLALRVDALEVVQAEKKLDSLSAAGGRAEKAAGGIAGAFKALAATLGLLKIADIAKDAAMMAARYETMGAAMVVVGNNAGYTGVQMAAYEQKLRDTGIAMIEARESLTKMASAQIDLARSSELARIAQDAAVIGNTNSSEAFNRMIDGIRSGEVEILKTIGLGVNFEAAYKRTAAQLGKNTDQLTNLEKTQARVNEVVRSGTGIQGSYEAAMGTAGKQIKSLDRYIDDLKVTFGQAFGPATTMLVGQLTGELKGITAWAGKNKEEIADWGREFRLEIIQVEKYIIKLSMFLDRVGGTLTTLLSNIADTHQDIFQSFGGDLNPKFKEFMDPKWIEQSSLKKRAMEWNKIYEDRHKANEQSLKDLDELEKRLNTGTSTLEQQRQKQAEQARILAGGAARNTQDAEERALAAKKKGEDAAKKAAAAAEKEASAYQSIIDRLLPMEVAQRDYAEGLAAINKMDPTGQTDRYKTALSNLNQELQDAKDAELERANAAARAAQEVREAAAASMESELSRKGTAIEISIAQGHMTEDEALPFQIDLLEQKLKLQQDLLDQMKKGTPEEISAWNSQADAIANTTLELARAQQQLRLLSPLEAFDQGLKSWGVDTHHEMLDFYAKALPNALDESSSAIGKFARDMAQGNATAGDAWKALGETVANTIFDILQDLTTLSVKMTIMGGLGLSGSGSGGLDISSGLGSIFGSLFGSANGNVFMNAPGLSAYSGSVVSSPTIFPFARGMGLMGEAGPEAIMPLARTGRGELGVKAQVASPNINVTVNNSSSAQATARVEQSSDGMSYDVIVEMVEQKMQDRVNRGRQGVGKRAAYL